jgi:GT2 family glycosyltransferase
MNVFILVVNYGTDEHLTRFLLSVEGACTRAAGTTVEVHVLDSLRAEGPSLEEIRSRTRFDSFPVAVHSLGYNSGYFGGLALAQALAAMDTDVLLYCNPDIVLEPDFFDELDRARRTGAGVLAPSIRPDGDEGDLNPMYVVRPTRAKLRRLRRIYSNTLWLAGHDLLGRTREWLDARIKSRRHVKTAMDIYAPHGSLLIFTDMDFFRALPRWECFLFLEELFIAEEARRMQIRVAYAPQLKASHVRHVSVAKLSRRERRRHLSTSVSHILERYYADPISSAAI